MLGLVKLKLGALQSISNTVVPLQYYKPFFYSLFFYFLQFIFYSLFFFFVGYRLI